MDFFDVIHNHRSIRKYKPDPVPDELLEKVPTDHRAALKKVLEQDPRPSYQNSEERVYGLSFAGMEIKFQVKDEVLHVVGVEM